jgi:MYXO-CTERM domain-containing protein
MKRFRKRGLMAALLFWPLAATAIPEGPEFPSAEWTAREVANYARTLGGPAEQVANPVFLLRLQTQSAVNLLQWTQRGLADPSWINPLAGGSLPVLPLCATWAEQCAGDPFRYPGVDPFYDEEGEVTPVVFYDAGCARLSGRMWKPRGAKGPLPGVVIETGSIQAPETLYWWMAQALVRQGYAVMTFDVRGQGRSDLQTPDFQQGSNFNPTVFWEGLVNVIDFFRSTPVAPYPHNLSCAGTRPTEVTPFNPQHNVLDRERLGIVGHSLGASGVSRVQSYGAPGGEPWPGLLDAQNPVDVIVAWDSLSAGEGIVPRVPAMGHTSEYGIAGLAFLSPPDPEDHKRAYAAWSEADVPVYQLTIQGSTHFEWSLIPTFPSSSWCPDTKGGRCNGGWGRPMAEHYSVAWLDRWLKRAGEAGYADADARLLADADWHERYSFHFRSARDYPTRDGRRARCEDIRAGCPAPEPGSSGSGGAVGGWSLAALLGAALWRRRRPAVG